MDFDGVPLKIGRFDGLRFEDKLRYLYSPSGAGATGGQRLSSSDIVCGRKAIEEGCDYFLSGMNRRMDENKADYMFPWDLIPSAEFKRRFGYDGGACTEDSRIFLSDSYLKDPEVFGGAVLFHERVHGRTKKVCGQMAPMLEETIAHRALLVSLGAYEEVRPSELYGALKSAVGDCLERSMLHYIAGEMFGAILNLVTGQDEGSKKLRVIPSYLRGI
jgi:hypothetical protein